MTETPKGYEASQVIEQTASFKEPDGVLTEEGKQKDKQLKGQTKIDLQSLLNDTYSMQNLEKDYEDNETMKELLDSFGFYIDTNLDKSFTRQEKEKIKLVLLGYIQDNLSLSGTINNVIGNLLIPLKNIIQDFQSKKSVGDKTTELTGQLSDLSKNFNQAFSNAGIDFDISIIDKKIQYINESKKQNKTSFDSLKSVSELFGINAELKTEKDIYDSIKTKTLDLSNNLSRGNEVGNALKKGAEKLPFNMGNKVMDFLRGLAESSSKLGFILSLIFGKEFLSEEDNSKKEHIANLVTYSEADNSVLKGLDKDFFTDLDYKKLKPFYDFLENNDIDKQVYLKDGFWEAIFTGKPEDKKLTPVYNYLKEDKEILSFTSDEKKGGAIIEKLNSLAKLKSDFDKKQGDKKEQELVSDLPPIIAVPHKKPEIKTNQSETTVSQDIQNEQDLSDIEESSSEELVEDEQTAKIDMEKVKKQYLEYRDQVVSNAVNHADKLPIDIDYGKKAELEALGIDIPEKIDFKEGKIFIGNESYSISFKPFEYKILFGSITISDLKINRILGVNAQGINIEAASGSHKKETYLSKQQFSEMLLSLIKNGAFTNTIPAKGDLPKIDFEVQKS